MTALAGDHIVVKMVDNGSTERTISDGDINSVDLGMTYTQHDVTGFGDGAKNFINGQLDTPVTVKGFLTTTALVGTHTVLNPLFQNGTSTTLTVQVGQNATPTTGDPEYSGSFIVESYKPTIETGGAIAFEAVLKPASGTAPSWGTVS
jgi:hypothetical protein